MGGAPRIDGYDIIRELGRGAMGVVYLARDRFLERDVALKVVADSALAADATERFLREARAMGRLSHPNVVTVFRAGLVDGAPFLVMELLRGRSLDLALERDGPLSPAAILAVATETARGLAAAHACGVVHRDIKPSNLFQTDEGTIKVLDFGIAKLAQPPDAARLRTPRAPGVMPAELASALEDTVSLGVATTQARSAGVEGGDTSASGTAFFMAPEVWRMEGADGASDVWSLGATLYNLATGRPPFVGHNIAEVATLVLGDTPWDALGTLRRDLPHPLVEAIERCLARDRAKRFSSAQELLTALDRVARAEHSARTAQPDAPYPGLRPMDTHDRDHFFGREDDVSRVIERLRSEAVVVLVGASGAGKSSLARAGVAPRIIDGALGDYATWRVVRVVPGRSPVASLAGAASTAFGLDAAELARELVDQPDGLSRALREAVKREGEGALLLVDQLEELVTMSAPDERDAIAAALTRLIDLAPRGVRVLATARSDLFDRLGALGDLGARLGRATELVRPLRGSALRAAVMEPARAAGYAFEDESLVDAITEEVGDGAEVLPLVAFALREWWDHRDRARRLLTRAQWEGLGGVSGALGAHAEAVFEGLSSEERDAARAVLTRLFANDGTRRYATRSELDARMSNNPAAVARALDVYAQARLLQCEGDPSTGTWTVSHEALARAWERLRRWLEAGREDRALHEQLTVAARAWETAGRRSDLLWRGTLLRELFRWRELYDDVLGPQERAFADASLLGERRRQRGGALALAAAALVLGGVTTRSMLRERRASEREGVANTRFTRLVEAARTDSVERAFAAAHALRDDDPSTALAWLANAARAGGRATPSMRAMALGLIERGVSVRVPCTSNVALREDGSLAVCAAGETVYRADLTSGIIERVEARQRVRVIAIAATGDALFWVDAAQQLVRWDAERGLTRLASDVAVGGAIVVDADGEHAVVGSAASAEPADAQPSSGDAATIEPRGERTIRVDASGALLLRGRGALDVRRARWREPAAFGTPPQESRTRPVVLALPEGLAAVAAPGVGVAVVDLRSGATVFSHAEPSTVAVYAEGTGVLLGLADGHGVLVDVIERRVRRGVLLDGERPTAVALSFDGTRVAAVGLGGDPVARRVSAGSVRWEVVPAASFRELRGATALAVRGDRLAVAGPWLGVVDARGLTTLSNAPAAFYSARVEVLRFVDASSMLASDHRGALWYTRCDDERCETAWLGAGFDAVPIERDASLALARDGSVRLFERGRHASAEVVPRRVVVGAEALEGRELSLDVNDAAIVVALPAEQPFVVSIALPPEDAEDFTRWVARRTNVQVGAGGVIALGEIPRTLL